MPFLWFQKNPSQSLHPRGDDALIKEKSARDAPFPHPATLFISGPFVMQLANMLIWTRGLSLNVLSAKFPPRLTIPPNPKFVPYSPLCSRGASRRNLDSPNTGKFLPIILVSIPCTLYKSHPERKVCSHSTPRTGPHAMFRIVS